MVTKRVVVAVVADAAEDMYAVCNDGTVFQAVYAGDGKLDWMQMTSIPLSSVDEPDVPDGYVVIDLQEVEPGDLIRFKDGRDALWKVESGTDPLFVTHHEGPTPRNFSKDGSVTAEKVTFAYRQEGA